MPKESRDVEIFMVANEFDAPKHAMQWQSVEGVNHHHHQKVRHGTQHSISTMGVGGTHAFHRLYYFSRN